MRALNLTRTTKIRFKLRNAVRLDMKPQYLAVLVTVVHFGIAITHGGPVAVPDVSAYLSFAQWLHGGLLPDDATFFPGYGLLLAPVGWMSGSALHTAALLFNSVLAGLCVMLTARFATSIGASPKFVTTAAIIAAIHPSISTSSRIAWPETTIVLTVLIVCLALSNERWVLVGIVTGLSLVMHPRLIAVVVAAVGVALINKQVKRLMKGLVPALAVAAVILQWTDTWPTDRLAAVQDLGDGPSPLLTVAGQWLALSACTAGLASVGLVIALLRTRSPSAAPGEAFLALSALVALIMAGWALAGSNRMDTLLYGRYIDPWAVPLAVVGLVALSQRRITTKLRLWVAISIVISFLLCLAGVSAVAAPIRRIMTLSLGSVWSFSGGTIGAAAVCATLICLMALTVMSRRLTVTVLVVALMSVTSTVSNHVHLNEVGEIADGQATVSDKVPDEISCLAHDVSVKHYSLWLYRLEVPGIEHRRVDLSAGQRPCGPYVIASPEALLECSGANYLVAEPRANWGLWKYPTIGCN